jgi:zinc transporter 9
MATSTSARAVVAALAGNTFVCLIKFIAFFLSGSGAMLSEAIHSAADTGNQLLLLIGLRRATREPDDRFPYGYGGERFVFGILSAAGIFFIGCGITLYHGVSTLLAPRMPALTFVTFAVLAAAFVIEGGVLLYAIRAISQQRGDIPFARYVREHADPATVAILMEDGVAVLGVGVAAGGISLSYATGNPAWDAVSSILVGLLLGVIAIYLVRENRELLLGRAVPDGIEAQFTEIVLRQPSVRSVRDIKTRQLTPEHYLFKAEITFDTDYVAEQLGKVIAAAPSTLGQGRVMRRLAASATDLIATETAAIEAAVRSEIPWAKHIDLEIAHPDVLDEDEQLA